MLRKTDREEARERRHLGVRKKTFGTPERPRLSVYRSKGNIYARIMDNISAVTLITASSLNKAIKVKEGNREAVKLVGELVAKRVIEKEVNDVVFDRGGYVHYGRAETLVSGARETGLKF